MAPKQDSLVKGTIILAVAALVARVLGLAQRIPLYYFLHDTGSAVYGNANNWYLTLLPIATAGIPSALSKLVSEKAALGRMGEAERIFHAALRFAVVAGLVITALLMLASPWLARSSGMPEALPSLLAIAPALLLFPVIAMMRGYFQGRQMMMAGGMSQIWEQILRVITAVLLAAAFFHLGYSDKWVSAGASFGGVLGAVAALFVMVYYLRKLRQSEPRAELAYTGTGQASPLDTKRIFRDLLKLSIPISLFSSTVSLINTIDTQLGIPFLQRFMDPIDVKAFLGILSIKAQSLAGIAVIFAVAVSQSLVPVISGAFSRGDLSEVRRKGAQALFMALLSGLAVISLIAAGVEPLNELLFSETKGNGVIALLSVVTIFQILMMTSGAILMGMGRMRMLMYNLGLCVAVKLGASLILTPYFHEYGMLLGTGLCYLASVIMNLVYLRRSIDFVFLGRRWSGVGLTVVVVAIVGYGIALLNHAWVHPLSGTGFLAMKANALVQCLVVGVVVGGVYGLMLFATRLVTQAELASMPGPVRRLLGKIGLKPAIPAQQEK